MLSPFLQKPSLIIVTTFYYSITVRTKMAEIPELGINAKGSYAIQEGSSISEIYHEAAGTLCPSRTSFATFIVCVRFVKFLSRL